MTNPATDAQNDAIHLSYDYNRLRFKTMPSAGGAVDLYNVEYIYGHYGDGNNGAGRVVTIKQGGTFKVDDYKYDELGQMAQEVKTFDVPNVGPRTFATSYRYDSFGRILKSIYPDGDQVTYGYYTSGELSSVNSSAGGISQSIISEIYYDGRGNISELHYGNGTQTTYDYADRTWTLMGSTVKGTSGGTTNVSLMQRARTCDHLIMSHEHLKYCFSREYTENIGLMELHVIPNVCSEYSEQKIQAGQELHSFVPLVEPELLSIKI